MINVLYENETEQCSTKKFKHEIQKYAYGIKIKDQDDERLFIGLHSKAENAKKSIDEVLKNIYEQKFILSNFMKKIEKYKKDLEGRLGLYENYIEQNAIDLENQKGEYEETSRILQDLEKNEKFRDKAKELIQTVATSLIAGKLACQDFDVAQGLSLCKEALQVSCRIIDKIKTCEVVDASQERKEDLLKTCEDIQIAIEVVSYKIESYLNSESRVNQEEDS